MRVIVIGAGSGGAAFAGTLAAAGRHEVLLLEAGPDYGPYASGGWPAELLDSRRITLSHDWGLTNRDAGSERHYALDRAKVVGGCSAHNGCVAVRGLRADFAEWAAAAGDFWAPEAVLEDFVAVERALRVRGYAPEEVTPFQQAVRRAALAAGLPPSLDINDLDEGEGVSLAPVNKVGSVRWNAAFGFLDPERSGGRLTILDRCEAESLLLAGGRAQGVACRRDGRALELEGDLVVLACGAYGTPMLLMRSGIGDPALLAPAGLPTVQALPGVGRNLQDHPSVRLAYRPAPALLADTLAHEARGPAYDEGIVIKARSRRAAKPVDLHLFSSGGRAETPSGWYWELWAALLSPRSRGLIRPLSASAFAIEHRHLGDAEGHDLACLLEGAELLRRLAATPPLAGLLEEEGGAPEGPALASWIAANHLHYWHPAGSAAMGREPAAGAVVDGGGRVHGVGGLMIADAAIMPTVTSSNTNLPAAMIGHRLARHLDQLIARPARQS